MPEIDTHLPKTKRTLLELLAKTNAKHLPKLDEEIERAVMNAWIKVHGTGQRRSKG